MEAIAGANRGGVAGCSSLHRESLSAVSCKRDMVLCGRNDDIDSRRGALRTVRQPLLSSDSFLDQSHVQFYLNGMKTATKGRPGNAVVRKAVARFDDAMDFVSSTFGERKMESKADVKAKKMEMKVQKRLKKAARAAACVSSSSSSSSSSESEASATTERRIRKRRTNMEKLRRDWEYVSQSPLMNSIPTISGNFVVEQSHPVQRLVTPAESICDARNSVIVPEMLDSLMEMRISSSVSAGGLPNSMAGVAMSLQPSAPASGVEVCMGGKCKKAGAQEVLSAFQANGVTASACNKCMKKCKLAVNLRVHQEGDDVPQMYSGIGVQDVSALSQKHFSAVAALQTPDSFLPSQGALQASS